MADGPTAGRAALKVLVAVPRLSLPGGVANYYRTLRPHLDAQKVYFEIGAKPGNRSPLAGVFRLLADYRSFHALLGARDWDLVHINPSMVPRSIVRDGLLLLLARCHGRPVLVFFRGWDPAFFARVRSRFGWLFRRVYGSARALVVLAAEFRTGLADAGLEVPVLLESTVVDDALFGIGSRRAEVVQPPGRACQILYLSRLDANKGLPEAIDAFALIRSKFPDVELTVAGDGPARGPAESEVARRGLEGIHFVGHVDEASRARLLENADIYFFPTAFAEGMPNSVLEAMAAGLPVVTRSVGGLKDFFEDGRMGFISESRDPALFARQLQRLLMEPSLREAMGRYNREYAGRRFAASVVAARLLEIYGRVAGQGGAR